MYAIETTPGFVIGSYPRGEAGKLFAIFTRDFGLVRASAQGIRLEKSKLRYHVQEYILGEFSLVRGREYWWLTNAQEYQGAGSKEQEVRRKKQEGKSQLIHKQVIARIASLLSRLLHGEQAHPELFACIEEALDFLEGNESGGDERMKAFESLIVFRIVSLLGYVGATSDLPADILSSGFSAPVIDALILAIPAMNRHINKAIRESHL